MSLCDKALSRCVAAVENGKQVAERGSAHSVTVRSENLRNATYETLTYEIENL
jgi:tRNA U54 and U55 pseudouridine synthase Pus10